MSCVTKNTDDLEICDGVHSEAGFSDENFFLKRQQVLTFPKTLTDKTLTAAELAEAQTLLGDALSTMSTAEKKGTLAGSIVLKTGMKWSRFPALTDSGSMTGSLVKEGSTSMKTLYSFDVENTLQNRETLNDITLGILAFKTNDGQVMVLGSLEHPAKKMKQDEKHQKSSEGERMVTVEFYCAKPPRAYYGNIQLTPTP